MAKITRKTPKDEVLRIAEKDLKEGCGECWHCCKYAGGYFLDEDIERIARHMKIKKEELIKDYLDEIELFNKRIHRGKMVRKRLPHGRCIFLSPKGKCSIHEIKPLHCRVGNCREHGEEISIWFALNYLVDENDPESIRQWAQYLKTHPTIEGGRIEDLVPDSEKLKKILSYEILR